MNIKFAYIIDAFTSDLIIVEHPLKKCINIFSDFLFEKIENSKGQEYFAENADLFYDNMIKINNNPNDRIYAYCLYILKQTNWLLTKKIISPVEKCKYHNLNKHIQLYINSLTSKRNTLELSRYINKTVV